MMKRYTCFTVLACLCMYMPAHAGQSKTIAVGDIFPPITTDYAFTAPELEYFGIERGMLSLFSKKSFAIADINAEIILVDFFNNYCSSCQAQAPVMNDVYKTVQKNPELRKKVRFIGIGAGNNEREVAQFKERNEVPFPLIADQRFSFYDAMGEPGGTPFMLILKKRGNEAVVVGIHKGLTKNVSFFISSLSTAAEQDIAALTRRVTEQDLPSGDTRQLRLNLTPKQALEKVSQSMAAACANCGPLSDIKQITPSSGGTLYTAATEVGGKPLTLYSRLFSQQPVRVQPGRWQSRPRLAGQKGWQTMRFPACRKGTARLGNYCLPGPNSGWRLAPERTSQMRTGRLQIWPITFRRWQASERSQGLILR